MRAYLRTVALYSDPKLAMVVFAMHAATFGATVTASAIAQLLHAGPAVSTVGSTVGRTLYDAWDTVPPLVTGLLFMAGSALVVAGVGKRCPVLVRRGAVLLLWLWLYAWLTLAVLPLVSGGLWLPTGWSRYGSPVVAAWWMYLRAPGAGQVWRRFVDRRPWSALVVLVVSPIALFEAVQLPVAAALPTEVVTVIISAVVSVLTLGGKAFADRMRLRVDQSAQAAGLTFERDKWAWDRTAAEIEKLTATNDRLLTLNQTLETKWSARELTWETANAFCRRNCPTFNDRPPA